MNCNKDNINYVVYHKDCPDGFASAWIAWTYLKDKKDLTFHSAKPTDTFVPKAEGKNILLADVTFQKKVMDFLKNKTKSMCIIDHHKSAAETMKHFDKTYFDMSHSAARITWKFFYPDKRTPMFIKYIEDQDIKGYKYKNTMYFSTALAVRFKIDDTQIEKWNKLLEKKELKKLIKIGKIVSLYKEDLIQKNLHGFIMKFGKHTVYVSNFTAAGLRSDVANKMAKKFENEVEFVIVWSYEYVKKRYSIMLRSIKDGVDLGSIAKKYGGGGHPRAAHFYHNNVHQLFT